MEIREYRVSDKKAVAEIFDDFQDYLVSMDSFDILKRPAGFGMKYLALTLKSISKGRGKMFIALKEGKPSGLIVALVLPKTKDPGVRQGLRGRITELYLDKAHRGKEGGMALMRVAERHLRQKGCKWIFIEVFTPNAGAHEFYKRLKYKDVDFEMIKAL